MSKIAFQPINFQKSTLAKIALANQIINLYQDQGYRLTLRQLYYQMVARDLIPNNQKSYKNLGRIVGDGRLAGLIDWDGIEDRLRNLVMNSHWETPDQIIRSAGYSFRIDKWRNQPNRIEIWVEKDALSGVLEPVARRHDVGFFAARGYPSLSEMYSAGKRFAEYANGDQEVTILHLGDHDPSGMDMTRDIKERVEMFADEWIDVDRLALNWEQIDLYDPPPNFAKQTDSRFAGYAEQYGNESWELDALEPAVLESLVEAAILELRDDKQWQIDEQNEKEIRNQINNAANKWDKVEKFLGNEN